MKKIKILAVSNTAWSDTNSFGLTYNALFDGLEDSFEFANVYCNYGVPGNKCVTQYCQITEKTVLENLKNKNTKKCRIFNRENAAEAACVLSAGEASALKSVKKKRFQISLWARDLVWKKGLKDMSEIVAFVNEFKPDVIFTPMYYMFHTNKIVQTVINTANVPVISYISDDIYRITKYIDSPFAMIDRFYKKRTIKKSISMCDMLYVACEEQKEQYEKLFGKECKVLRKPADIYGFESDSESRGEKLFLYAGNLGTGRAETIAEIGKVISETGNILRVYSVTPIKDSLKKVYEKNNIDFRGQVSSETVERECLNADILLYAEGFGRKDIALSKFSVSTKFPWYLGSGRLILAVGPEDTHTIRYLKCENAAIVATDKNDFSSAVKKCLNAEDEFIQNAKKCAERDFNKEIIQKMLKDDILRVVSERGDDL